MSSSQCASVVQTSLGPAKDVRSALVWSWEAVGVVQVNSLLTPAPYTGAL